MKSCTKGTQAARLVLGAYILGAACWLLAAGVVQASERQFLVVLANSPKQYRATAGLPPGGLPDTTAIHNQYFDGSGQGDNPNIYSFAEYWEEVSYGDVQISGTTTFWINLQWSIQPPLVAGGTVDTPLDDSRQRNSPANFYNLSGGGYGYGQGEGFSNAYASTAIDRDGNPGGLDNGPSQPGPGSGHMTAVWSPTSNRYVARDPVWKPGERFVDMDEDGRWDALDEANNEMDWNGDGQPDLRCPWVDLNADGEAANASGCEPLDDSDNDGNPDCCPEGPGDGCPIFSCPSMRWEGPGGEVTDCNGNLIPDACDLSPQNGPPTPDCQASGWLQTDPTCSLCGLSVNRDQSPYEGSETECTPADPDGIPDECQFLEIAVGAAEECVTASDQEVNVCLQTGMLTCTPITTATLPRCEFHDSNGNRRLDIVEPFENFIRRWDPVAVDPEASLGNRNSGRAHWVKVDAAYIEDNYPAQCGLCSIDRAQCGPNVSCRKGCSVSRTLCQADNECPQGQRCNAQVQVCRTGIEELIAQSRIAPIGDAGFTVPTNGREVYGKHDPQNRLGGQPCRCADGSMCQNVSYRGQTLLNVCLAGIHAQFDPPDSWGNVIANNAPGNTSAYTTKMQPRGSLTTGTPQPAWYDEAWLDRYSPGGCPNPDFNPSNSPGPANPQVVTCTEPEWVTAIPDVVPYTDSNVTGYVPETNRRYFRATYGGTTVVNGRRVGRGRGWLDCSTGQDAGVVFEIGDVLLSFEDLCNHPIRPEEAAGEDRAPIFYDGWVEHDDLPSSKYHRAGDQRLGEVTSPYVYSIWGEDRGAGQPSNGNPDQRIPAAGPYAGGTDRFDQYGDNEIHGNNGRDAGNVLTLEYLTWRTMQPFNNGYTWERELEFDGVVRSHPYAGPSGANLGFRDYNLDGLIDQGEVRFAGSENYLSDSYVDSANDGVESHYPWNRDRLMEDCIEILDYHLDFDDFVDAVTMRQLFCGGDGALQAQVPPQFADTPNPSGSVVSANGVLSGIVLMPAGAHTSGLNRAASFVPIHNEDNDDFAAMFPRTTEPHISWNLFFHNLVTGLDVSGESGVISSQGAQTGFAAHEYMHTWQRLPDLYDYDVWRPGIVNCPVGAWDIMATGGLVHPAPPLKESFCTQWLTPVDLTTILTPGVVKALTLPPSEFVRDNSHYFLPNPIYSGERFYFWSVGSGFNQFMPGEGMLIMHTDLGDNPDALPLQQTYPPFSYEIVQADGLNELLDCGDQGNIKGDAGDPWPGTTGATAFNFESTPPARWTRQNSWTGLDIEDVIPDGAGSVQLKLSWEPTDIPSLKFIDPPGGVSVPISPSNVRYRVKFRASDVHGGTTIGLYYTKDETKCSKTAKACVSRDDCPAGEVCTHNFAISDGNRIGQPKKKTTPGTNTLTMDWNIYGLADERYVLFAELVPGVGEDNQMERAYSIPRAGRNNIGNGSLVVQLVNIAGHKARSETWTVTCIDAQNGKWQVTSNLTQPAPDSGGALPDAYKATTGTPYTSVGGEVKFTISAGSIAFALGDTFSFTTTGITAPSASLNVIGGRISEDPVAIIEASPLAGDPPLTVNFDGRKSRDPNGETINYLWNFGDGSSTETGAAPVHTFTGARTYTVVLKVTNPRTGRFGESAVDIAVTNNSPKAVISATPSSGGADGKGLTVQLSGAQSSDRETPTDQLTYQWTFGDGGTANDALTPGKTFQSLSHLYKTDSNGVLCTHAAPCNLTATLKVIDGGGKSDSASATIVVGNTNPVANITYTSLQGASPLTVVFNAINSYDAEKEDTLKVDWDWNGDGTPEEKDIPLTGTTPAKNGSVPHTYQLPAGETKHEFKTKATVKDNLGGKTEWPGVTVVVSAPAAGSSYPRAVISPKCDELKPIVGEELKVSGSKSVQPETGPKIASYTWEWGDGSQPTLGMVAAHTYTRTGTFTLSLTVADGDTPPHTNKASCTVVVAGEAPEEPEPENRPPVAVFTVEPEIGSVGTEFTFNAGGSVDPDGDEAALTFSWSFGDGQEASDAAAVVTHVFEQARPEGYVVRLWVRDERNATTEATREVIVQEVSGNQPPVAYIARGPRTGSAPLTLTFDGRNSYDPNDDPLEFSWDFTLDGRLIDTRVGPQVTRVFSTAGDYTVTLEVADGRGGVDTAGPEQIVVIAPTESPEEPEQPRPPTDEEPGDSADNRPAPVGGVCGLGMLPAFLGSLTGLAMLAASRRRFKT